jgi:hypothetical protein
MSVSVDKNPRYSDNSQKLSQGLKILGVTGIAVAGVEQLNKAINNKASKITTQDYINGIVLGGVIGTSVYGALGLMIPLWRELTEYRPDDLPFLTAQHLHPHHDKVDDLYS